MKKSFVTACAIFILGCSGPSHKDPHVMISTAYGDIEVELAAGKAPKTTTAFLSYVDSGFYTNSSFYRVLFTEGLSAAGNIGLIQGGIYGTNENKHPNVAGVPHETTQQSGLSHTNGTISLARTTAGTGNTEFFICIGDQSQFDFGNRAGGDTLGFAAFGKVVKGMSVVRKIQAQKSNNETFEPRITINKIARL
jgi:peptidyl-prolyl cis-trans isomerase A (cyclophilin A)